MSGIHPGLLRAYDLRGRVGVELTEADAEALGRRYATALLRRGGRRVAVGYDGRLSSPMLETALVEGLIAGGAEALRIGRGPTGMLYFAVHAQGLDGGIMVTGSHNPPDQNGFKLLLGREPVHGEALAALVRGEAEDAPGGRAESLPVEDAYVARLLAAAEGAPPLRIGWDPGNGATGEIVRRLADALPGEHKLIHDSIDGLFPAHHPDPSVPDNLADLQTLVRTERLDLGIAFDGDGDRIGVVDGTGAIVWADQLLLFLARDALRDHPGASIVGDVKSSRMLFDGIAEAGGRPLLSPSGYVRVREAMIAADAPLAGEMSGHIFYADRWYGTDDALHVAMRLLAAIGRSGGSLADFRAALPESFATPELRMPCPDEAKAPILAAVADRLEREGAAIDRTDGLRVATPDGWWLLRGSGTEPKLTARIEAWSPDALVTLRDDLAARLAEAGLEAGI
ncbi:MAG TPA: phosphomannomutase/phosphoglucomutase [Sphingomonas sp.]|nr:phosphomannomutase/phosphoglucomutase [Sphingomonas sp.]